MSLNKNDRLGLLIVIGLCTGCASNSAVDQDPLPTTPVARVQIGDDALNCGQLQEEIFAAERIVSRYTQIIDGSKNQKRSQGMLRSLNGVFGAYNPLTDVTAGLVINNAEATIEDAREVRDSYQGRRDTLLQQYMALKCSVDRDQAGSNPPA